MKIGILGSRGIPNRYGGFEECAEMLATRWAKAGHEVVVYSSSQHPYKESEFKGVKIVHRQDPEKMLGAAGQFIYDFNCIINTRLQKFDVILVLGYTSSSIWGRLFPQRSFILTNMDGLEWKRSKYRPSVQRFLKLAESWAVSGSHVLIADARQIAVYLEEKYQKHAVFIPYGAIIPAKPEEEILAQFVVKPGEFNLVIARLEPENHLEIILQGVMQSQCTYPCLIIGNHNTPYGERLKQNYRDSRIRFIGAHYEKYILNALRYYCTSYFHGHSVGGTNPSLLEAMACSAVICAHNNPFNKEVLEDNACWFLNATDISNLLDFPIPAETRKLWVRENLKKIKEQYNWDIVAEQYLIVMEQGII